jgi:hypothetical protein
MKEKILALLKTKLAGFAGGVEEGFLLEYAEHYAKSITEETAIATTLTDGVIDQIKVAYGFYNKEVVKKTAKAQETALKTWREKHGLDENGKLIEDPNKKKVTDPEEPAWFTAYKEEQQKANDLLKADILAQKQEKTLAVLSERVSKHEKLKDIPASYLKGRNLIPKSEAEIDQLAAEIETDYNGFKQEMAEKGVVISQPPTGGGTSGDKSTIDTYLDEKFPKEPQGKVLIKK